MTDDGREPPSSPRREEMSAEYELAVRKQVKAELRKRMKAVRAQLPKEAREARSRAICAHVIALPEWTRAHVIAAFLPMGKEVDVTELIANARANGKRVLLPRVDDEGVAVSLHEHHEGDAMETSSFGVSEPLASATVFDHAKVDLVIVPALALDDRGHRIGYGGGYYDRLLPSTTRAIKVAVAFDFQLIAEVPTTPHDVTVDVLITDTRTLRTPATQAKV